MRVKIGEKIYDASEEPIMLVLSQEEKKQISEMENEAMVYCQYPDTEEWKENDNAKIKEWLKIDG